MLIATPCVNASVVLHICAADNPTCAIWINWRPQLTLCFNHFSRNFRESRTKDPSDWSCMGSFAHNERKSMRAAEGRVESRNSDSISMFWSLLLRKSLKYGFVVFLHVFSSTQHKLYEERDFAGRPRESVPQFLGVLSADEIPEWFRSFWAIIMWHF